MSKVKFEIKNRWTGDILFEYEKENNTLKETVEKAVKEGANLEGANLEGANLKGANLRGAYLYGADLEEAYLYGANLEGANLKGANLRGANLEGAGLYGADLEGANLEEANLEGAYLYLWDDDTPEIDDIANEFQNNTNIKINSYYINKHILSPYYLTYWKNGLIIDEYEYIEPKKEVKKMTVSEICKELGYEVEIVKEENKDE